MAFKDTWVDKIDGVIGYSPTKVSVILPSALKIVVFGLT